MKNCKQKILSGLLASAMVLGMGATQLKASAFTYPTDANTITGEKTTTFKKFLIVDDGDNVPNVTFNFTIAAGTPISLETDDNSVMEVRAGVGTPTIRASTAAATVTDGAVTFAPGDTSSLTDTTTGHTDVTRPASDRVPGLTTGVELEAGEKFAVKELTVDFTSVVFPEPGIYRYVITETADAAHEAAGIMHDNDVDRILDVYVHHVDAKAAEAEKWTYKGVDYTSEELAKEAADSDQGANPGEGDYTEIVHTPAKDAEPAHLEIAGYVLHTNAGDVAIGADMGSAGGSLADKTDGFTNEYNSKDLAFKKEVTGNQASRDKYFEFTVTLDNVNDDDVFTVSLADDTNAATNDGNADATSGDNAATIEGNRGKSNPTTLTGAQLKAGAKFYLQHGQHIVIRGIAPNATYTVIENAEDYKSTASAVTDYDDATTGTIGEIAGTDKMVKTSYLNTREGVIPTGILTVVGPAVVLILLAVAGLSIVMIGKRRKEESAN